MPLFGCGSKPMVPFWVGAPLILVGMLLGIEMFTRGNLEFDPWPFVHLASFLAQHRSLQTGVRAWRKLFCGGVDPHLRITGLWVACRVGGNPALNGLDVAFVVPPVEG